MSDSCSHAPHLPVASFTQYDFNPRSGYRLAEANGRVSRRKTRLPREQTNACGSRPIALNRDSLAQPAQFPLAGNAVYLHPVSSRMFKPGVTQTVLQRAIIGQQHEPFAVMIQTSHRIYIPDRNEPGKRFPVAGKLANHTVRFIENDVAETHSSDYLNRRLRAKKIRREVGNSRMEMPRTGTALPFPDFNLPAPTRSI